jgi:tRNA pseudouridine38-40 synthase
MTLPTLYPESGFCRLRLDIAYDGTNFFGWAIQPDLRTVQVAIESALSTITQSKSETIVAGRTDAGVHATGQVVHVDIPQTILDSLSLQDLGYKLNRMLDEDVRIMGISIAPPAFHARFSALRRAYSYRIIDANKTIPPLTRLNTSGWYRQLDVDVMNQASALLLGQHDFAAFCKFREGATTIRTLEKYTWSRDNDGVLIGDVVADAFCYSMVRNLVGAVVCVADGRFETSWISTLLANRERVSDSLVFPARGLSLYRVEYPTDAELLDRATQTILRREEESN